MKQHYKWLTAGISITTILFIMTGCGTSSNTSPKPRGNTSTPKPTQEQLAKYPGFESFKLTPAQTQEIRSVKSKNDMGGVTIYVPSEVPKGTQLKGVQFGIQTIDGQTTGVLILTYTNFGITFGTSKYFPQYSKPFQTIVIDGVLAKWHKNVLPVFRAPSPGEKQSVQYILELTKRSTHIEIATMLQPEHISMEDINNVARSLVPLGKQDQT